jgi:hypothetical protein
VSDWIKREAIPWLDDVYSLLPTSLRAGMNEDMCNLADDLWALARHLETLTPTDR